MNRRNPTGHVGAVVGVDTVALEALLREILARLAEVPLESRSGIVSLETRIINAIAELHVANRTAQAQSKT